jgi:hypothetical protein
MVQRELEQAEPRFRQLGKYVFQVRSRAPEGGYYTVDALHLTCTCRAGYYGIRCWHLAWAIQQQYWQAEAEKRAPKRRRRRARRNRARESAVPAEVA